MGILIPIFSESNFAIVEPVKNIKSPINTLADEFAPALAPDGSFLIFNSKRNTKYQELYISEFDFTSQKWKEPKLLVEVNSRYNDEAPTLSSDGQILIFSSDRDGSFEAPKDRLGRIKVSFDLYYSVRKKHTWSIPQKIEGSINTIHHEKAPSLSKDGKRLYYTRWKFGQVKNTLIMKAEFKDGRFINAVPMPPVINSGFQELALIESDSGNGYFFSSLRPGGFGGWDIYYVSHKDGKFGEVTNLGDKVNSAGSDAFLSKLDQRFFICSNRDGGEGRFDIYSTFIFSEQDAFETRTIYFDYNSPKLKKESYPYLDALSKYLQKEKETDLNIIGHTDLHGSDDFNLKLSLKRAKSIKAYLLEKGISPSRLSIEGKGESEPIVPKLGEKFDQQNRRTEFELKKPPKKVESIKKIKTTPKK